MPGCQPGKMWSALSGCHSSFPTKSGIWNRLGFCMCVRLCPCVHVHGDFEGDREIEKRCIEIVEKGERSEKRVQAKQKEGKRERGREGGRRGGRARSCS